MYLSAHAAEAFPFFNEKKETKNVFACPKAAFRSGPILKKGKHGLWYCKNDLLRSLLNFYNTKVNKTLAAHRLSIAFLLSLLGKLFRF